MKEFIFFIVGLHDMRKLNFTRKLVQNEEKLLELSWDAGSQAVKIIIFHLNSLQEIHKIEEAIGKMQVSLDGVQVGLEDIQCSAQGFDEAFKCLSGSIESLP